MSPSDASPSPSTSPPPTGKQGYKHTLNLPKTPFPMKANLVQAEPASLKRWDSLAGEGLYPALRRARAGAPPFIFHDGPPYANGNIHLGHLMNKCLKDFVVRTRSMGSRVAGAVQPLDAPFIPGWDCHGLPIEHMVVSDLMRDGKLDRIMSLEEGPRKMAVRRACRAYAEKYHKLHTSQMKRLLTLADYDHPYLTMQPAYEARVLEVLAVLLERGLVYRAVKPVHWSVANETALAEAELEYHDRTDDSVYSDFEAADPDAVYDAFGLRDHAPDAEPAAEETAAAPESPPRPGPPPGVRPTTRPSFMIWTTTPWTLPANLAIAVHPDFDYALVFIDGNITVIAADLVEKVAAAAKAQDVRVLASAPGARLVGLRYRHPFVTDAPACALQRQCAPQGIWSIVTADYVTLDDGTGLVHTAPGHGHEDFHTGLRHSLPIYSPVRADGTYDDTVPPWLRGIDVWKANHLIVEHLRDSGHLFFDHKFSHAYPHDWRSKTPVIFRCTEQWFVAVDHPFSAASAPAQSLRERAASSVLGGDVQFVPDWGRNRLAGMLDSRPDWCISRQRAWGLPIPAFLYEGPDGDTRAFMTPASIRAIAAVIAHHGSDAWFTMTPADLLANYDPAADPDAPRQWKDDPTLLTRARKGPDILDVWFESGSSWAAVLQDPDRAPGFPADLYLEGSDQHRGWFQLSLLTALGVTAAPPFRAVLTHGFIVDRDGRKLSKSRPDAHRYEVQSLCAEFGMDVMRWWVASLAYENDVKADTELFALAGENYRKIRNTLRFMLSNLYDYNPPSPDDPAPPPARPTDIDAWALAQYDALAAAVIRAYDRYDFRAAHAALYDFCNHTLSAVYLAAVKDRLYCDRADSPRRRQTQAALYCLTDALSRLLAPILCHTADEACRALRKVDPADASTCVHLLPFIPAFNVHADPAWDAFFRLRDPAHEAMERAKRDRGIDNPLDAALILPDTDRTLSRLDPRDLADALGVSRAATDPARHDILVIDLRDQPRCDRSWKRDGTVKQRAGAGHLSDRDAQALGLA